jgi:guanosine-3',5'-bis(diphosphate) 3'-pyrophosphohydrolase
MKTDATALLLKAVAFAAEKHRHQKRKDVAASPYINHPIALANLLVQHGVGDIVVLCAAMLHDTIEDTKTTAEELRREFGNEIAEVVLEVTDDKTILKEERKRLQIVHAGGLSARAKLVKLADKTCNLRDMVASPPAGWPLQRKLEYFEWAKAVVDELRGAHARFEALFDSAYREGLAALAGPNSFGRGACE